MKKFNILWLLIILGCEEVVNVTLPAEQNLVVVEGWLTDRLETQQVRLTRSNSFGSDDINPVVHNATVAIQALSGSTFSFSYGSKGHYLSDQPFAGISGEEYRVVINMSDTSTLSSEWEKMPLRTEIVQLNAKDFEDIDPDNPTQIIRLYFPRITARDSAGAENYYRWVLFRDSVRLVQPESITIQNDRFFDGNFIPNAFDDFAYKEGEEMKVELHSITKEAFDFLSELKSQTTALGTNTGTTPAIVNGNMKSNVSGEIILGFFGTTAISADSTIVSE